MGECKFVIKNDRQKKLLRMLSNENSMKISDLSIKLNSSMMTIRRDLDILETNGIVQRFHGGVMLTKPDANQPSFHERIEEFNDEKYAIGKEAAKLIKEGNVVFFDAGTTALAVVEHIPDNMELTAITTGLLTAVALCNKPRINVVNIGGDIHHSSYSSAGYISVDLIKQFYADIAFISTKSVCLPEGTYEAHLPLIKVKQAIVEVSRRVALLVDNSKFEVKSMCLAVDLADIDVIITDSKVKNEYLEQMEQLGKNFIVSPV